LKEGAEAQRQEKEPSEAKRRERENLEAGRREKNMPYVPWLSSNVSIPERFEAEQPEKESLDAELSSLRKERLEGEQREKTVRQPE
jgi:hypothetical protein